MASVGSSMVIPALKSCPRSKLAFALRKPAVRCPKVQSRIGADGVRVEYPYTINIKGTGKKGLKLTPFGALKKEAKCMTDEDILQLIDCAK